MRIPFAISLIVMLSGCSPIPMIALSNDEWKPTSEMPVKGRSGFFIRQKLSFGEYRTSSVTRSWTKGSSWRAEGSFPNDWLDRIAVDWVSRKQTVRFTLTDDQGRISQVTALARVQWRDLQLGDNPSSLTNIMGNMLRVGDDANDTYAVRIFTNKQEAPWEMLIDNYAAQRYAKSYIGILARSNNEYYTVVPVYRLRNPQGAAVNLPFGGSVGFEFKNREGKILAAVSLIGNGAVYMGDCSDEEKFLLANASAALLLQQLLDEGVR
jgi:hypothetical protein